MKNLIIHAYSINDLIKRIDNMDNDLQPSLAFVYTSPKYDIRKLVVEFNRYPFLVFGATTVGEIYANEELGVNEKEESIVCMLIDINPNAIALRLIQVEDDQYYKTGKQVAQWAKKQFVDPAVITVTAGLIFDNDAYTQGIVASDIEYVFGGAAGDDLILKDTFIFSKDNFSNHGIIALAIDRDKIDIIGARAFGWTGMGKDRIVTKAHKNIVYKIDGKPAIDFYKKYLNIDNSNNNMTQIGIEYPLEVIMRNGQVVYRAVLEINENDGSLIFAGHVEEKSRVRLSAAKGKVIIDHVENSIKECLAQREDFKPDITLVFPCCSRKQVLGDLTIKEIEAIYRHTGVPLIGFFAYGEIGAFPGGYGFHNETFVTALLRDKEL